ncbi:MAG: copper resistance protein NlpE [Pigmentiphaga sp.]
MKKALGILLVMSAAVMVAACNKPTTQAETSSAVPDGHTSRNALDWAGVYEGVVPCADCPGIEHRLTLEQSGGYQLETRYLERSPAPQIVQGSFTWNEAGSTIRLDQAGSRLRFQVGENRLWMLNQAGERISGPLAEHYILNKRD